MKINLEVRNNPLVIMFSVYVDGIGIIAQAAFKNEKPGVFTYAQDMADAKSVLVRFTVIGQGGTVQSPTGVCLVCFGALTAPPNFLKPYIIASVPAGHTADTEEFTYPTSGGPSSVTSIPDFDKM